MSRASPYSTRPQPSLAAANAAVSVSSRSSAPVRPPLRSRSATATIGKEDDDDDADDEEEEDDDDGCGNDDGEDPSESPKRLACCWRRPKATSATKTMPSSSRSRSGSATTAWQHPLSEPPGPPPTTLPP